MNNYRIKYKNSLYTLDTKIKIGPNPYIIKGIIKVINGEYHIKESHKDNNGLIKELDANTRIWVANRVSVHLKSLKNEDVYYIKLLDIYTVYCYVTRSYIKDCGKII